LAELLTSHQLDPLPIHVIPMGRGSSQSAPLEPQQSSVIAKILATDYVLSVGTIEARKNPSYLFNIWKMMATHGRSSIPQLVFAGQKGCLVRDFLDQLKACNHLDGRIVVVHDVTDSELDLLYQKCLFTVFPSFIEGWAPPVGESLAFGKICLCSPVGGIPEAGRELADYIDPYSASDGLKNILRYLDNPNLRGAREREIVERFKPRTWRSVADDLLTLTQSLARQVRPNQTDAAILLPPNRYLRISSDPAAGMWNRMDGTLSAEVACVSGWNLPEVSGVRAAQAAAMLRFRASASPGIRINVGMRLAAFGRDFRIRLRSASGAETEVSVAGGSEKFAVLPCEVEPGNVLTVHLESIGASLDEDQFPGASYWMLKGILYFDSKQVTAVALNKMKLEAPLAMRPLLSLPVARQIERPKEHFRDRIQLRYASMDESQRAASLDGFRQTSNCYWPFGIAAYRAAPIFADQADRRAFYSACGNKDQVPQVGKTEGLINVIRRSGQYVSMSRFSEGAVFDDAGVWRAFGYLQGSPPGMAPWLSKDGDALWIAPTLLTEAPYYEHSYLFFYNGNLHNYYHWLVEGLLSLDVLSRLLGSDSDLKIVLPKSMNINSAFNHGDSLQVTGLGGRDMVEAAAHVIKVREAIWIDGDDLVRSMPGNCLREFQHRIAEQYGGIRGPRNKRLLVARNGPSRKIHNIEQVEVFLTTYNFETVYLEGMSALAQILLFQTAEFIIAPHGAGLANLLFCAPGTKVIELMPSSEMRPFFWFLSEKLDLVHGMQFCDPVAGQDFHAAMMVDIGKLQALIRMVDAHL